MKKTDTKKNMIHVGNILQGALDRSFNRGDLGITEIWNLWESAVGDHIARNTRPAAFKGSLLLVTVSSSAWMQHLGFLKEEMIGRINTALNRDLVKDLKFKIGNI